MEPFKNRINPTAAKLLATQIKAAHPTFPSETFLAKALSELETLELKARVTHLTQALAETLPPSIPEAIKILIRSLPPAFTDCETLSGNWHLWPVAQFIENHGLAHHRQSLAALTELTQRFTAEFAIRPFIIADPKRTLADLQKLTTHPNPHVRRWCSEGTRPHLPWGKQIPSLIANPTPLFPILESLKNDPELYVRRSVANNLNDIAKDHPNLVVTKCAEWKNQTSEKLIRHALRSLIKNGHPAALKLLGYPPTNSIEATLTLYSETVNIGTSLPMLLTLNSKSAKRRNLLIDYAVHYVRQSKTPTRKVFKWKTLTLPPGKEITLTKNHSFRLTTIRTLHPGTHRIEILINGHPSTTKTIQLLP